MGEPAEALEPHDEPLLQESQVCFSGETLCMHSSPRPYEAGVKERKLGAEERNFTEKGYTGVEINLVLELLTPDRDRRAYSMSSPVQITL